MSAAVEARTPLWVGPILGPLINGGQIFEHWCESWIQDGPPPPGSFTAWFVVGLEPGAPGRIELRKAGALNDGPWGVDAVLHLQEESLSAERVRAWARALAAAADLADYLNEGRSGGG